MGTDSRGGSPIEVILRKWVFEGAVGSPSDIVCARWRAGSLQWSHCKETHLSSFRQQSTSLMREGCRANAVDEKTDGLAARGGAQLHGEGDHPETNLTFPNACHIEVPAG